MLKQAKELFASFLPPAKNAKPQNLRLKPCFCPAKNCRIKDLLMRIRSQEAVAGINKQIAELEKSIAKANEDLAKFQGQTTSIMGLRKTTVST